MTHLLSAIELERIAKNLKIKSIHLCIKFLTTPI